MKKFINAVALFTIVAAPVTAMAEGTTLYGQLRYSFNSINEDIEGGRDGLSGEDNISLFGLKGSYGENVKAFFHLQTQAYADGDLNVGSGVNKEAFKQRFFFGGLEGGFGKVAYGRMTNAYKFDGFALDPFYNYSHVGAVGRFNAGGATYGLSAATNGFSDNALQYVTPSVAGFKLQGGVYLDDSNDNNHGYSAGISYSLQDFKAGVVYATNNGATTLGGIDANGQAIRGYASYDFTDNFKTAVSVENVDISDTDDAIFAYLTSTLEVPGIDMEFSASLGLVDNGPAEGLGGTVGAWYNVAKNTKIFALASYSEIETSADYGSISAQPLVISLGAQHKFSISSK